MSLCLLIALLFFFPRNKRWQRLEVAIFKTLKANGKVVGHVGKDA